MVSQEIYGRTLTPDSTFVESQPTEDIVASLQAECTQHLDDDTRVKIVAMVRTLKQRSHRAEAITGDLERQLRATTGSLEQANTAFAECEDKRLTEMAVRQGVERMLTVARRELEAATVRIEELGGAHAAGIGAEDLE